MEPEGSSSPAAEHTQQCNPSHIMGIVAGADGLRALSDYVEHIRYHIRSRLRKEGPKSSRKGVCEHGSAAMSPPFPRPHCRQDGAPVKGWLWHCGLGCGGIASGSAATTVAQAELAFENPPDLFCSRQRSPCGCLSPTLGYSLLRRMLQRLLRGDLVTRHVLNLQVVILRAALRVWIVLCQLGKGRMLALLLLLLQ